MLVEQTHFTIGRNSIRSLLAVIAAGVVVVLAGVVVAPERTWPNVLLSAYYLLGLGLAGTLFIAFLYITNAGWGAAIKRVPEAISANVYSGGLLMLVILLGIHYLYEWSHVEVVASDPILQAKSGWLNVPFFSIRTVGYLALWSGCTWMIVRTSRRQDETGASGLTVLNRRYSAIFLVTFGLTFWIASMDWIMSIEPHWYSTIFGIYHFSGVFLSGIAAITMVIILLRRRGVLIDVVRPDHLHDLGKLIFAFSTFWMYIWFSQYMLIWYSNIPEETTYFIKREGSGWGTFAVLNLLFNWLIPFVFLLPKRAKQNEGLLLKVCLVVLIGHWIDLFWMILPPFMPEAPFLSIWEVAPMAVAIALFFLVTYRALGAAPLVPTRDPMLVESLHYHS